MPMAAPVTKKTCIIYAHYLEQNLLVLDLKLIKEAM